MATKKHEAVPSSIGRALNFATGRMNALCQHRLDPHALTLPQWVILSCLWRDGDLTIGRLAELIGNGLPATSRIVDRMAERGLVARARDKVDGRVTLVRLGEKGEALRHLSEFHTGINETLFEGFTAEEEALAFQLLAKMQRNAERALEKEVKPMAGS